MKDTGYFVVQGWMCNQLQLKGNDLLIFAIIYGFSRDGSSQFNGSLNFLQESINASRPTVIKSLKSLMEKKVISKEEFNSHGMILNKYRTLVEGSKETLPPVKDLTLGSKESLLGVVKDLNGGSKESLPNNITNNIKDNIIDNKPILQIDSDDVSKDQLEYFQIAKMFVTLFKNNVEEKGGISAKVSRLKYKDEIKTIRLMITKDEVTKDQFRQVYDFLNSSAGEFWHSNILSCFKLRKQFNTLILQSKRKPHGKQEVTTESKLNKIQQALAISRGRNGADANHNFQTN